MGLILSLLIVLFLKHGGKNRCLGLNRQQPANVLNEILVLNSIVFVEGDSRMNISSVRWLFPSP